MKTNTEINLEKVLDLPEAPAIVERMRNDIEVIEPDSRSNDIEDDYKYARQNLRGIIDNGTESLDILKDLALASQSPRAFEVIGQLIKTLADANKDLMKLQKDVKELKKETDTPSHVTNALFIGNTAELQKLVKSRDSRDHENF